MAVSASAPDLTRSTRTPDLGVQPWEGSMAGSRPGSSRARSRAGPRSALPGSRRGSKELQNGSDVIDFNELGARGEKQKQGSSGFGVRANRKPGPATSTVQVQRTVCGA